MPSGPVSGGGGEKAASAAGTGCPTGRPTGRGVSTWVGYDLSSTNPWKKDSPTFYHKRKEGGNLRPEVYWRATCRCSPARSILQPRGAGTHTEHPHVGSASDLLHEGQGFPFRDGDCAKNHGARGGQRLTNRLGERLTEELHLPNLIDDTHSAPWAAAGTCLKVTETEAGAPKALGAGVPLPVAHQPAVTAGRANCAPEVCSPHRPHGRAHWQPHLPGDRPSLNTQPPEPPRSAGSFAPSEQLQ